MNELLKAKLVIKYIFFELLPVFLMGVFIFIFVLLMFQILKLTDFILLHGVDFTNVLKVLGFMTIRFIPVIFPLAVVFATLLTYSRLSADSEIVGFKSIGLNTLHISVPALILGVLATMASLKVSSSIAPWGSRAYEVKINNLQNQRASITIKPGVFSEVFMIWLSM